MRLFIALDIDDAIRQRIARFMDGIRDFAPDVRWVRPESLHITLKFIGEKSALDAEKIKQSLSSIELGQIQLTISGYGFFPTPKSARVFWVGIVSDHCLTDLAAKVDEATMRHGSPKEDHPYTPHLTLARGGSGSGTPRRESRDGPNRSFQKLQEKLSALAPPEFGNMTAWDFFLYESQLLRGGARYTKIAGFPLRSLDRNS
jgi:RNA 2',3'-cyclic 3'-phosphodiesterase